MPNPDNATFMNTDRIYQIAFSLISSVATALAPTLPYILLCTAAVLADCYTAWQLGKRVRKTYPQKTNNDSGKFKSSHFGAVLLTLLEVYALLVFAHFTHIYITGELSFNALKIAAGLVIGWQLWSCLENISSCNGKRWAKILQQIMVDKTARHFDVNLDELQTDRVSEEQVEAARKRLKEIEQLRKEQKNEDIDER